MRKKKDCRFGEMAFEEVGRLYKSKRFAIRVMGISRSLLYDWKYGTEPGAFYLAKIHYLGGDVMYILTGQRSIENGETRNRRDAVYDGPNRKADMRFRKKAHLKNKERVEVDRNKKGEKRKWS